MMRATARTWLSAELLAQRFIIQRSQESHLLGQAQLCNLPADGVRIRTVDIQATGYG